MKRLLITTTALMTLATAAAAQDKVLNVLDWGGAYGESHKLAYNEPFQEKTGIKITVTDADNPATPIKAMVEAGLSVSCSTDNRLMSGVTLSGELAAIHAAPGLSTAQLAGLMRNAVAASFLPTDVRERAMREMDRWDDVSA